LKSVVLEEGLLERMQRAVLGQPLDGRNLRAFVLRRQRQAGENARAVAQHRARAARSLVAAFLRAGKVEIFPQRIQQRDARLYLQLMVGAIDPKRKLQGVARGRRGLIQDSISFPIHWALLG